MSGALLRLVRSARTTMFIANVAEKAVSATAGRGMTMGNAKYIRIALVYSGFGGMAQALWAGLRDDGHEVVRPEDLGFEPPLTPDDMLRFAELAGADVIFCPFLKEVVPPTVCARWTTWIPHPGIRGDGGPSSLSWAILEGEATWGLTMCGPSRRSRRATSTRATSGRG